MNEIELKQEMINYCNSKIRLIELKNDREWTNDDFENYIIIKGFLSYLKYGEN